MSTAMAPDLRRTVEVPPGPFSDSLAGVPRSEFEELGYTRHDGWVIAGQSPDGLLQLAPLAYYEKQDGSILGAPVFMRYAHGMNVDPENCRRLIFASKEIAAQQCLSFVDQL